MDEGRINWRIMIDRPQPARAHMAADERLAQAETPILRLWTWEPPAVSLGLKQPLPAWLEPGRFAARGLEVVQRPTGGGMAFHGSDVSLAVVLPRRFGLALSTVMSAICGATVALCRAYGADARAILHGAVSRERITYCLTQPSAYAVLIRGRKAAGFSIRRYPTTWLIQGSLLVSRLPDLLREALPGSVSEALSARAIPLSECAEPEAVTAGACPRPGAHVGGGLRPGAVLQHRLDARTVAARWAAGWSAWWDAALLEGATQGT